jgi:hypothetical protein
VFSAKGNPGKLKIKKSNANRTLEKFALGPIGKPLEKRPSISHADMAEMNARWNQQEQAPLAHRNKSRLHGYRRETCQPIQLEHYIFAIEHVVGP